MKYHVFESLIWFDLRLNPVLPDHWRTLYSLGQWPGCKTSRLQLHPVEVSNAFGHVFWFWMRNFRKITWNLKKNNNFCACSNTLFLVMFIMATEGTNHKYLNMHEIDFYCLRLWKRLKYFGKVEWEIKINLLIWQRFPFSNPLINS